MRILITGGAGFIGSHLARALLARACEVVCIDNASTDSSADIAEELGCTVVRSQVNLGFPAAVGFMRLPMEPLGLAATAGELALIVLLVRLRKIQNKEGR